MARYRRVSPRIWSDARFMGLSDDCKLVFLFLLTHPQLTSMGALRGNLPGLAAELGWALDRFGEAMTALSTAGMVDADTRASFIGIPNFLKHNAPENPNVVRSWEDQSDRLPECPAKERLLNAAEAAARERGEACGKAFEEAFSERRTPPGNGMPNGIGNGMPNGIGNGMPNGIGNGMPNPEPEPEPEPYPEPEPERGCGGKREPGNRFFADLTEPDLSDTDRTTADSDRSVTGQRQTTAPNGSTTAPAPAPNTQQPERGVGGDSVSRKPGNGFFRDLDESELNDPSRILAWYERAAAAGQVGMTDRDRLEFHATAVHARSRPAGQRVGNFIATLKKPLDKRFITNAEEQTAVEELAALRRRRANAHSPLVAGLGGIGRLDA